MSTTLTVDASGTVTLPAELCREAGAVPGTEVVADVRDGRLVVAPARPTLAEWIATLTADIPPEELDKLPVDGASQHDHYLYGTPKRTDLS
jgi:bifunctional DNA-binding transcriptional regulator/antitoxin component of YhaV-PrlF toxin-antitoxin module